MAYGITIKNDKNEIQIDGLYKNFSLHDSGSWSVSGGQEGWYGFTPTVTPPIVAIRPSGLPCRAGQYQKNASLEYYRTYVYGANDTTLPYIVFTEAAINEIPSGAYGLAIYNEYGNLVFHNHNKWCQFISATTFAGSNVGTIGDYIDITVENADNNYFIFRPLCDGQYYNAGSGVTHLYMILMRKVDTTTIRIENAEIGQMFGDYGTMSHVSDYLDLIEVSV